MIEGLGPVFDLLSGLADLVGAVGKFFSPKKETNPHALQRAPLFLPVIPTSRSKC